MTRRDEDFARVAAVEDDATLPGPEALFVRLLTVVVCLALAWGFAVGTCAGRDDGGGVAALRAREDSAHVRAHRALMATRSAVANAERATGKAERAVARYAAARSGTPPVVVVQERASPARAALPVVRGGWGAVTIGDDTLPTPRVVIGALVARDAALAAADTAITEQRLALTRWAVAGRAFLAERAARDSATAAMQARMQAQLNTARARARRWAWIGASVGALGALVLVR